MRQHHLPTLAIRSAGLTLVVIAAGVAMLGCGSSKSGQATATSTGSNATPAAATSDVKTGSTSLGTVLVDAKGVTLYHLTAEQKGKFICTGGCLQVWHPLLTHGGQRPKGAVGSLGTIQRPEGSMQITYKGLPLYTFAQDARAGQTKGQGVKDVGTWTVITVKGAAAPAAPAPSQPSTSTGGSGGYGY
jgi:predicted lipoprotein with Yx(FWY)xxD motif